MVEIPLNGAGAYIRADFFGIRQIADLLQQQLLREPLENLKTFSIRYPLTNTLSVVFNLPKTIGD